MINDVLSLARYLQFCSFSHVKCMGNLVAYFLARSSKSGNELHRFSLIPFLRI